MRSTNIYEDLGSRRPTVVNCRRRDKQEEEEELDLSSMTRSQYSQYSMIADPDLQSQTSMSINDI